MGGADDEVDVGVPLADAVGTDLGHASGNADDHVGPGFFEGHEFAQEGEGFVFGLSSNRASVEDDNVGGAPVFGLFEPEVFQIEGHLLAVFFIHLAAPGLNEVSAAHGFFAATVRLGTGMKESDVTHTGIRLWTAPK